MKKFFGLLAAIASIFTGCAPKAAQSDAVSEAAGPDTTTVQHPDWSRNAVIYEVNTRQYTPEGTFAAFGEHIGRLKELGVDILWFMPIHPISEVNRKGELGSCYAVRDYKAVNPEFGTLDDFRAVVDKAHEAGMKVIIDWVPNHTGCDNAWVEEHPEYYKLNDEGKMYGPYDWTDVYQLDYSKPGTREAMTESMAYWLREAGIEVAEGLMADEARALNRPFMTAHTFRRPFVTLKWAQSADGFMDHDRTAGAGAARFSTPLSSQLVHWRRACHDAIAVGAGTAIADRPRLDVRHIEGRSPRRILFDRHNLLSDSGFDIHITGSEPLSDVLSRLYSEDSITSLLVEGGPSLLKDFIGCGLWDEAYVEVSPETLGERGRKPAPVIAAVPDAAERIGPNTVCFYSRRPLPVQPEYNAN